MDFLLGNFAPQRVLFEFGFLTVYWYGLCMALAVMAAFFVVRKHYVKHGGAEKELSNLLVYLVLGGFVGARLFHVFVFQWDYYQYHPNEIIKIWEGGIAIQGALLFGAVVLLLYAKVKKTKFFKLTDTISLGLPLGQAIGRIGNFFNQELYGFPTQLPWGIYIEEEYRIAEFETYTHFHPTFFYESILNVLLFVLLLIIARKKHMRGILTAGYLIGYGVIRFIVDFIRIDPMPFIGPFRFSQAVSIILVLVGAVILVWAKQRSLHEKSSVN